MAKVVAARQASQRKPDHQQQDRSGQSVQKRQRPRERAVAFVKMTPIRPQIAASLIR